MKIALSPGAATPAGSSAPAHSCYITYSNRDEAEQAILAVDGVVLDGRTLKASFGTPTKYAQLSDELDTSRDSDEPAASSGHSKTPEPSRVAVAALDAVPTHSSTPAVVPPPAATPADGLCNATVGPAALSAAIGRPVPGGGPSRCFSMPERCSTAAAGAAEFLAPMSGRGAAAPEQAVQGYGAAAVMSNAQPPDLPVQPVRALATSGGDPFSWPLHAPGSPKLGPAAAAAFSGAAPLRSGVAPPYATGSSGVECSDSEPWSIRGFDELLSGSLPDEVDEEPPFASSSRFARFFGDDAGGNKPRGSSGKSDVPSSGPGASRGLGDALGAENKLLDEDWQQGFRALLPDVNISFSSPFGEQALRSGCSGSARPQPLDGLSAGLGGVGTVGAPSSFHSFGSSSVNAPQQIPTPAGGPGFGSVGNGGGGEAGSYLLNGSLHHAPLNGVPLPGLPGDRPATSNALLEQLSVGSLPSAHLPTMGSPELAGAELSSQLQSLLQGAGGGELRRNGDGAAAPSAAQPIASMRLMPGWLPTDNLLAHKLDVAAADATPSGGMASGRDIGAPGGRAARDRRGGSGGGGGSGEPSGGVGGSDRGSKAKKRGGTNRGGGGRGAEPKPVAAHK